MAGAHTIKELLQKYARLYQEHTDRSPEGKGREKAYLDVKIELAEIATLPTQAAQKRQLQRMVEWYEGLLPDSDPIFAARNEMLKSAVGELKQIKKFVVISR